MDPTTLTLEWFLSTAYGKRWTGLDPITYADAYIIASSDPRMIDVLHNCPDQYSVALSMSISLILQQSGVVIVPDGSTPPVINPTDTGKIAYVTKDRVADVERSYTLVDAPKEVAGSLPSNLLARIFEDCKSIGMGMRLIRSRIGCGGCGSVGNDGFQVGDMSDG
jgi:hypothetical protein